MRSEPLLTDVQTLRTRARQHVEEILAMEEEHAEDLASLLLTRKV